MAEEGRWAGLCGGYRTPYDPRNAIGKLRDGDAKVAWDELWQELHHQGDVGEASYAAVPLLAEVHEARAMPDWNTYALAATIEEARHNPNNPGLPDWLVDDYDAAWQKLQRLAIDELPGSAVPELTDSIIAVLAFGKGRISLGQMAMLADDERKEMLENSGWG
ncbi:MAG TPA: hypothetical protein VJ762_06455 [Sphingobium sp.]|nr:hypothetical protein [Sphingobium sp.]